MEPPPPPEAPSHLEWIRLSAPLFDELDVFGTGPPLLEVDAPAPAPWSPAEGFPPGCSLLVPFQDPENVGAVIRSGLNARFGTAPPGAARTEGPFAPLL